MDQKLFFLHLHILISKYNQISMVGVYSQSVDQCYGIHNQSKSKTSTSLVHPRRTKDILISENFQEYVNPFNLPLLTVNELWVPCTFPPCGDPLTDIYS